VPLLIGLSFVRSSILVVLPERSLPFLPPGVSVASRIGASRSIKPALRKALAAIALLPGTGAEADETDIMSRKQFVKTKKEFKMWLVENERAQKYKHSTVIVGRNKAKSDNRVKKAVSR